MHIFLLTDVEIGILAIPYEINESENTTDLAIYVTLLYGTLNQTVAVELHTANGNAISTARTSVHACIQ